jgi:hypothetical protein
MSKTWNYRSGDWWAICDVCAKKVKASKVKQRWDGLMVCPEDYEHRHPQDFIKVKQDNITVPWSRPRPQDIFGGFDSNLNPIDISYIVPLSCIPATSVGEADIGVADCARADIENPGGLN